MSKPRKIASRPRGQLLEVELRVWLKNKAAIGQRLHELGARIIATSQIKDWWYCPKAAKNVAAASIDRTGYALRIREVKDGYTGNIHTSLECKTLSDGKNHATCQEHEMELTDVKMMQHILSDLGLKKFLLIDKCRIVYAYQKAKFCLDAIKGLGSGLEIEMKVKKGEEKKTLNKLHQLAKILGIGKKDILKTSLTRLGMHKLSKF